MISRILRFTVIITVVASVGSGDIRAGGPLFSTVFGALPQSPAGELTPASVALLANNWNEQAIDAARRAIASGDPAIRAVAARVAAAANSALLADAIAAALEREQDSAVAVEQVRALLFLRGAAVEEPVRALFTTSSGIAAAYSEWLSRMKPETLAEALPAIAAALKGDSSQLSAHVLTALERRPNSSEQLLRGWLGVSTPASWRAFLDRLLLDASRAGQDDVLIESLNSKDIGIREATVWNFVVRLAQGRPVPAAVLEAALPVDSQDASAVVTWEQFGREIIARLHAGRQTPDRAALVTSEASKHVADSQALAVIPQATEPERRAVRAVFGAKLPEGLADYRAAAPTARRTYPTRTVPTIWPGLLKGLTDTAACKVGSLPGLASVVYRPDGRVERVAIDPGAPSAACERVVGALARLTIADGQYPLPVNASELLVLPLDKDYIECVSRPHPPSVERSADPGKSESITPPRKIRDVKPFYPAEMQQRRIQGTVLLETVISVTGCVPSVRVIRSVAPLIDYAAVRAVSGWRFTPARVDGRDVSAIMTVTVNFRLE